MNVLEEIELEELLSDVGEMNTLPRTHEVCLECGRVWDLGENLSCTRCGWSPWDRL